MQAYDLVNLRSTASCRIVGIAAASEGGAVAGVIDKRQSRMIGELDLFLSADWWPQGREHGANVVAEELRREPAPADLPTRRR